jgi:hypothetical protein
MKADIFDADSVKTMMDDLDQTSTLLSGQDKPWQSNVLTGFTQCHLVCHCVRIQSRVCSDGSCVWSCCLANERLLVAVIVLFEMVIFRLLSITTDNTRVSSRVPWG